METLIKRLVIPDSHGQFINKRAAQAAIEISRKVKPDEIVFLGDQLDASGLFSHFKRQYLSDRYDFRKDVSMCLEFMGDVIGAASDVKGPAPAVYMLEGNHENHVERWIADVATSDTEDFLDGALNPYALLKLKERGVTYVKRSDLRKGLSVRGVLMLKGCAFMHGGYLSIHATHRHAIAFGANICHGHTHRSASVILRRPTGELYSGHCPGTLAEFAPLYQQTTPESWSHGVGLQFVDSQGTLNHYNVSINNGKYMLP
jgi:predicted phosphodiesterase